MDTKKLTAEMATYFNGVIKKGKRTLLLIGFNKALAVRFEETYQFVFAVKRIDLEDMPMVQSPAEAKSGTPGTFLNDQALQEKFKELYPEQVPDTVLVVWSDGACFRFGYEIVVSLVSAMGPDGEITPMMLDENQDQLLPVSLPDALSRSFREIIRNPFDKALTVDSYLSMVADAIATAKEEIMDGYYRFIKDNTRRHVDKLIATATSNNEQTPSRCLELMIEAAQKLKNELS